MSGLLLVWGVSAAHAEDPPPPLEAFVWGTKPAGMVVASFPEVQRSYWDEPADDWAFTQEPGGLAVWPRDCDDQTCWQRLTSDGDDRAPAWSPSGYLIAYLHGRGTVVQVRVLDTRTGESRTLATGNGSVSAPTWSHDEQQIAYSEAAEEFEYNGQPSFDDFSVKVVAANGSTLPHVIGHDPETAVTCEYANEVGVEPIVQRAWPSWSPVTGNLLYLRSEFAVGSDWSCGTTVLPASAFADEGILGAETVQPAASASMYGLMGVRTPGFVEWSPDEQQIIVTPQLGVSPTIYPAPGRTGPTTRIDSHGAMIPPSWAPDDAFILSGGAMLHPDGSEVLCYQGTPPGVGCYMAIGDTDGHDAQCRPGFCLTGIAATQVGQGDSLGPTQLSGAITSQLDALNRYAVKKTGPGTYQVTATPPAGAFWDSGVCDDENSTVSVTPSSATATYRVVDGEFVTCTFGMARPDGDGDGWPDDVDPCPADPQNTCDDPEPDADSDGLPDDVDPCPADPTNTCDDPPKPDTCVPYQHEVELDAGAGASRLYEFDSIATYRICTRSTGQKYVAIKSVLRYGSLDSGVLAYLLGVLGFEVQYAGDAPTSTQILGGGGVGVTSSGKFEMCFDFMTLVDKVGLREKASKLILTKLGGRLGKLAKADPAQVEAAIKSFFKNDLMKQGNNKIADFMDKARFSVIPYTARAFVVHEAQGAWKRGMDMMAKYTVAYVLKNSIKYVLQGERLLKGLNKAFKKFTTVCFDVWEPRIEHRFTTNGAYTLNVSPIFANPIFARQKLAADDHHPARIAAGE